MKLFIDIETYSDISIDNGVYAYAQSKEFEILLFAYSLDDAPVKVIDIKHGEQIPQNILDALTDSKVTKHAFNANFERVCLSAYLKTRLSPEHWRCTMVTCSYNGLPMTLKGAGEALEITDKKMDEGKALIKKFCTPHKELIEYSGTDWEIFKAYNKRDVEAEMEIESKLPFSVPDSVWSEYATDQRINDRGALIDYTLVNSAIRINQIVTAEYYKEMKDLTGLQNPKSTAQLKTWLKEKGIDTESLDKEAVADLIKTVNADVRRVLELRRLLSKSSVKKYEAMADLRGHDDRVRGCFQFYGSHTGREAGRHIQLQNLPQNHLSQLSDVRKLVRDGDIYTLEALYDNIPQVLSELIRTTIIPKEGCRLFVADFSAIEARVIAWLAKEYWKLEAFENGEDLYCSTASKMFGVPVKKNGINGGLRAKGKIAELACIAEGSLVLTDQGLVPIEQVTTDMRVWDGVNWVEHEGVVFKGIREVITYEGLTATPDHLVWVEGQAQPIQLSLATTLGLHLTKAGDHEQACEQKQRYLRRQARVYDIRNAGEHHCFTVSGHLVHNCGYGGSVGALEAFGAVKMGIPKEELKGIVDNWRKANPNIVKLWYEVGDAASKSILTGVGSSVGNGSVVIGRKNGCLVMKLPSGRLLVYEKPSIGHNKFGGESITYYGIGINRKWCHIETMGARLVENIIQAIARDLLFAAMQRLEQAGYEIIAHVHDEVIIEAPGSADLNTIIKIMCEKPYWAEGMILNAAGFVSDFYMKD